MTGFELQLHNGFRTASTAEKAGRKGTADAERLRWI
jgi:hypothetical protein